MIELIYGGSGSGKSGFAEKRVMELNNTWKYYVATMKVYGEEGEQKVQRHRKLREGKGFITLEQSCDVGNLCKTAVLEKKDSCILLECMSNLVANEMFTDDGNVLPEELVVNKITEDIKKLSCAVENLVIVSNNIFEDGIEYDVGTKNYMKALSGVNCILAEMAESVVEVVVGIPVELKAKKI